MGEIPLAKTRLPAYPAASHFQSWNQQVGADLSSEPPSVAPAHGKSLSGHYVDLVPFTQGHVTQLWDTLGSPSDEHDRLWTYMLDGPFSNADTFPQEFFHTAEQVPGAFFFAIVPKRLTSGELIPLEQRKAVGRFALIRMDQANKSIEVGHVIFASHVQKSPITTEPFYLLGKYVFDDLQFIRWEWKCNEFNLPSRRAADRFGFKYEGTFRRHYIVKGRARNTTWFSMLRDEWDVNKKAFELWLDQDNFDQNARQKKGLKEIRQLLEQQ